MPPGGRGRGNRVAPKAAELLPALEVDKDKFFLVHTLFSSSTGHPRLLAIHRLLSEVAVGARAVVKGTDSQRRFNVEFTQFFSHALGALADLEDAVYEATHPGQKASDAADAEVSGVAETDFVKEVAAFVATQTQAVSAQYLEHVATTAMAKTMRQQETQAVSLNARKRGRPAEKATTDKRGDDGGAAASPRTARTGNSAPASSGFDDGDLGLLDEQELLALASAAVNADSQGSERSGQGNTAFTPPPQQQQHKQQTQQSWGSHREAGGASPPAEGWFVSADGSRHDLRRENLKLTSIEEFKLRLEPWKIPPVFGGVELERVTVEKEKRVVSTAVEGPATTTASTVPGLATAPAHTAVSSTGLKSHISLLDVCLSPTPAELLRAWENRELALAAFSPKGTADGSAAARRQPRRRGGSPGSTVPPPSPQAPRVSSSAGPSLASDAPTDPSPRAEQAPPVRNDLDGDEKEDEGRPWGNFFPRPGVCTQASVPSGLMRQLVFNGISSIEFLY